LGRMQVVLSDEAERELRDTIYRTRGSWKKGYISEAIEEAVREWVARNSKAHPGRGSKRPR
jgi:hypothetical protein